MPIHLKLVFLLSLFSLSNSQLCTFSDDFEDLWKFSNKCAPKYNLKIKKEHDNNSSIRWESESKTENYTDRVGNLKNPGIGLEYQTIGFFIILFLALVEKLPPIFTLAFVTI